MELGSMSPAPTILEPIVQKNIGDCALASLAMLLGLPYQDVSAEALRMTRKPHTTGLGTKQINALAKRLKAKLEKVPHPDLEVETGIIYLSYPSGDEHAAVLFEGILINPADGLIYSLDVYLATHKAEINGLWRVV